MSTEPATGRAAAPDGPAPRRRDVHVPYLVRRLQAVSKEEMDRRLATFGVSTRQYTALSILGARGALSNAQLARRCLVSPQAMSEVVVGLEARGLVARTPHPAHGRILQVALTAAGGALLERCDEAIAEMEELMLADLSPAGRRQLVASLESCLRALGAGIG